MLFSIPTDSVGVEPPLFIRAFIKQLLHGLLFAGAL